MEKASIRAVWSALEKVFPAWTVYRSSLLYMTVAYSDHWKALVSVNCWAME